MGKYVVIWFLKCNCVRVFSVSEIIIQQNSFYVLYMLLGYDMVQFIGLSVAVILVIEYRHLSVTLRVAFGVICNSCVEHV
jgi:hypothetical protein